MPKTNGAARKPPTHFEQVPLEVVKAIAVEDSPMEPNIDEDIEKGDPPAPKKPLTPVPVRSPGKKRSD